MSIHRRFILIAFYTHKGLCMQGCIKVYFPNLGTGSSNLLVFLAGKDFDVSLSQNVFACAQHWVNECV